MKDGKAEKAIRDKIDAAVEAPIHPDQREIEMAVLATLAAVINSDVSELKYSLLGLDAADFYFQDHRDTFAAMKALANAGDHVDQMAVKAKGASWPDEAKANADAAETYKEMIRTRPNLHQVAKSGREFLDATALCRRGSPEGPSRAAQEAWGAGIIFMVMARIKYKGGRHGECERKACPSHFMSPA